MVHVQRLPVEGALEGRALEPPHVENLVELLTEAMDDPDRLGLAFLDRRGDPEPLSIGELTSGAFRIGRRLAGQGLVPGESVLLLLPSGRAFAEALFGVFVARGVAAPWPVPMVLGDPTALLESLMPVVEHLSPARVVTTERLAPEVARVLGFPPERIDTPESPAPDLHPLTGNPHPDDAALIQYTSGPVGEPTGVVLTHRQILANVQGVGQTLGLSAGDVAVSWIPLVHDMGLIGVLFSGLYWGYPTYLMPPESFLMRPQRWLEAVSRFGGTISAAPNFAYELAARRIRDAHLEGLDLSTWRLALNGAEQVQPATIQAFAERFAPVGFDISAFCPLYGLAENSLAATCPRGPRPLQTARPRSGDAVVVSVGVPIAGQSVAVVEPGTLESVDPGEVGEIVVSGPSVMAGYLHDDARTGSRIVEGWLRTGDLGFIRDGELHISGRLKEMVIKMGRNYYPADVEAVAGRQPDVHGAVAFGVAGGAGTEDLVLVVESEGGDDAAVRTLERAVSGAVLASVGIRADRFVVVPPGSLPLDRLARQAAGRALAAGEPGR